jgi:hypothetical protein
MTVRETGLEVLSETAGARLAWLNVPHRRVETVWAVRLGVLATGSNLGTSEAALAVSGAG